MNAFLSLTAASFLVMIASCASDSGSSNPPARESLSSRINGGSPVYGPGAEGGNRASESSKKRSSFESKGEATGFNKQFDKKQFASKDAQKKALWSEKQYAQKQYEGDTDGSRFLQSAQVGGKSARESRRVSNVDDKTFATRNFSTNSARESSSRPVERQADALTESRRDSLGKPRVVDFEEWKEQRNMTVEQATGILGRLR